MSALRHGSLECRRCFGRGRIYKNGVRPYDCLGCAGSGRLPESLAHPAPEQVAAPSAQADRGSQPALTVWYGKMPESNGRENWTAELRRVNPTSKWSQSFCFARSEYPGRVLYEADRMRWIIGERSERPDILAYDADTHSGYVAPTLSPGVSPERIVGAGEDDRLLKVMTAIAMQSDGEKVWLDGRWQNIRHAAKDAVLSARGGA